MVMAMVVGVVVMMSRSVVTTQKQGADDINRQADPCNGNGLIQVDRLWLE